MNRRDLKSVRMICNGLLKSKLGPYVFRGHKKGRVMLKYLYGTQLTPICNGCGMDFDFKRLKSIQL